MKEIAIFGGSFNPPTKAHEAIIRECLSRSDLDEVWIMPSGDRLDKGFDVNDYDRLNMINLMIKEASPSESRLQLCTIEIELPRPTQTWRTVKELQEMFNDDRFWYVYGADAYYDMPAWEEGERLQTEASLLIVARDGARIPTSENIRELRAHSDLDMVSSTAVRERVAKDLPLDGWVCQSVATYIKTQNLYN